MKRLESFSSLFFWGRYIISELEASVYICVVSRLQSAFLRKDDYILFNKSGYITALG